MKFEHNRMIRTTQNFKLFDKKLFNLWTWRAGLAAYANGGPKNPAGRFSGICYGVS